MFNNKCKVNVFFGNIVYLALIICIFFVAKILELNFTR